MKPNEPVFIYTLTTFLCLTSWNLMGGSCPAESGVFLPFKSTCPAGPCRFSFGWFRASELHFVNSVQSFDTLCISKGHKPLLLVVQTTQSDLQTPHHVFLSFPSKLFPNYFLSV